ncbi:MAG: tetratricopeptide repeat protein, partial [Gammaproteobacteria bacterium]|nr:tetratricopeptide repeat protein [Gammaproteobacteria bacterium]
MCNPPIYRQHGILFAALLLLLCAGTVYAATLETYLANARGYEAQGAFSSALIELKNAVQKEPASAEARRMLGELYLKLGDGLSAQKELNKALLHGAEKRVILPSLGRAYLLFGDQEKLLEEIRVSDETPVDLQPELYTLRGNAYLLAEQHDQAQAEYNNALALQENYSDALLGLARLALMSGDLQTARQKLDAALLGGLDSLDGRMVQAELSTREGNYETAIEALQQLLAKVPDYLP